MSYQLEWRHLRYFLAVAENLNFRKAAEQLYISQPGLSRQIKQMEDQLGTPLFDRTKRVVQLTQAGIYLKEQAVTLLGEWDTIQKNVSLIGKGLKGEFKIGFVGSAMQKIIPDFLLKASKAYPDVRISLKEISINNQVKAIQNNELDMGFVRLSEAPKGMELQEVMSDSFAVVLPQDHQLNQDNFRHIGQLKTENFIMFSSDYSPLYYKKIMSICHDQGFEPKISHKSVHAQTIFKLVEAGLGVAIIPSALQHGYDLGVKFITLKNIRQKAVLSVLWKKDNQNLLLQHMTTLL